MGNSLSSIFTALACILPSGEDTPASLLVWTQHGEQQLPVISRSLIGVKLWRQGLFSTVGETFVSHWTVTARLKLGSPQSIRYCPATVCYPHGVHGD